MTDCPTCSALRDRIAYLERELALTYDEAEYDRLKRAMVACAPGGYVAPGVVQLVLALYQAQGRPLTIWQLLERLPSATCKDDQRDVKIVTVYVCRARAAMGADAIATVWARGYRLTDQGIAFVRGALRARKEAA